MTSPIEPEDFKDGDAKLRLRSLLLRRRWWAASVAAVTLAVASLLYVLASSGQAPVSVNAAVGGHVAREPGAEHPSGASVAPVARVPGQAPERPAKARDRGHVIEVVNNGNVNACSLISGAEVNQIMGRVLRPPVLVMVGSFDECATSQQRRSSSASAVRVAWAVPPEPDPALAFRQLTINLPRSDAVQGLGEAAYCSSQGSLKSELFVLDPRHFLETFADTCAHAEALARIELTQV